MTRALLLTAMRRIRRRRRAAAAGLAAAALAAALWIRLGPLPPGLLDVAAASASTSIVDRHGEVLYEVRSDLGTRGQAIDASHLPPVLAAATLAAEDVRFRSHTGVDPVAIVRAAVRDVRALRIVEGGSTITQQVAKLLLATRTGGVPARGWVAKAREAVVALRLEHRLRKDDILALYLNLAPYGNQIVGAERAAREYFGRSAASLTPGEAAFLAALPQQPSRYNPWRDPDGARARQRRILATMHARGWLSAADLALARSERLALHRHTPDALAPHFVEYVKGLADAAGTAAARPRRIEATLDAGLQRAVHGILASHRAALTAHHANNVAVAVLDNATGDWLAWEGSGDYFDEAHGGSIDGVLTPRQPGSALKPFTYAAAFERGATPGHVLADVPSQFPTAEPGILYSPRNYDGQFRGPLLARAALAGSENVPAVALASDVGVPAIARLLRQAGIATLDHDAAYYGLGLTLGNAEVRLGELVNAYATFARGGEWLPVRAIRAVDGRPTPAAAPRRIVSQRTAFWIGDILADDAARAYIFGRGGSLEFPFTVAAKTGTSQAYHDNWAIGYTREVTVGVWVGNFDRSPLQGSSGVTGAAPIFHDVLLAALQLVRGSLPIGDERPIVEPPADLHQVTLCATSGMAATDACPVRTVEWLPAGAALDTCTWHHASDRGLVTVWPSPFQTWARDRGLVDTPSSAQPAPPPPPRAEAADAPARLEVASSAALTIVAPLAGARYLFDPTLRSEFQKLPLRAQGGDGELHWSVDDRPFGIALGDRTIHWPLARGRHRIAVVDDHGRSASVWIDVR